MVGVVPIDTGPLLFQYKTAQGSVRIGHPIYVTEQVRETREVNDYDVGKWETMLTKGLESYL
ncbi:hypothetical protein HZB02_05270 [Candidatus Woesearchaeota archaeon]|nr:hypothetical protein [Candidatus Woesearchaeota archaeon]